MREALALARRELGPQALVLSSRLVPAQGVRGLLGQREVEITAAVEPALSESRHVGAPVMAADTEADTIVWAQQMGVARREMAPPVPPGIGARLGRRAAASQAHAASRTSDEAIIAQLCAAGLDRALAAEVAEALPARTRRTASLAALRKALSDRLAPLAAGAEAHAPIEVFVGPPGAGKTTTVAKIAAQNRARRGSRLSLLAADGYRVGAVEQLRLYAEIIGAPFSVARTAADLEAAVSGLRRPVLVDTAGRSPSDQATQALFDVLAGRPDVRTHLVIPAGSSIREATRIIDRYAGARPDRVVLTKVDEADTWTGLIPLLRERGLALSYLGTGQAVPDDLTRVTPSLVAASVLGDAEARTGVAV
ncbi:MAG: hypothetical protein Q8L86_03715 [Vicinamibacterales bacterium]|nr:hypothetical protein [Vicinamibacterales bacterium]